MVQCWEHEADGGWADVVGHREDVIGRDSLQGGVVADDDFNTAVACDPEVFQEEVVDSVAIADVVAGGAGVLSGDDAAAVLEVEDGACSGAVDLHVVFRDDEVRVGDVIGA